MKKIFKKEYVRRTTDNKWVLVYILTAFLVGLLTAGTFIKAFDYFRSINQPTELLSPLSDILPPPTVLANEIKKEDTRWWRLYKIVRLQESSNGSRGLAVTCKKNGMVNDIGYLPYKGFCFPTLGDQEMTFANWINKRFNYDGLTENQLLCLWNTGKPYKTCANSQGNLSKAK